MKLGAVNQEYECWYHGPCLPGSVFTPLRQFEIFFTGDNNSRLVLRLLILCIIAGWLHIRDQEYLRPPGERSETRVPRERGMDNYWKETQVILRPDICGNQPLSSLIKLCPVNANCFLYKFKHRAPSWVNIKSKEHQRLLPSPLLGLACSWLSWGIKVSRYREDTMAIKTPVKMTNTIRVISLCRARSVIKGAFASQDMKDWS